MTNNDTPDLITIPSSHNNRTAIQGLPGLKTWLLQGPSNLGQVCDCVQGLFQPQKSNFKQFKLTSFWQILMEN